MSWWTDIRDAVTAPFRAVGSFVQDIAQGENFFESLGRFATREFFALNPMIATNAPLVNNIDPAKELLKNDYFNALTAGIGNNIVGVAEFTQDANTGRDFSYTEARDAYLDFAKGTAKVGAAALAAGAAPATASAYTTGAAAYTGAQGASGIINKLESGDVLGAISSAASTYSPYTGLPEIPPGVQDAINAGKDVKQTAEEIARKAEEARRAAEAAKQAGQQAAGLVDLTKSNLPPISRGYSSNTPGAILSEGDSSGAGSMTPLLLVGGTLALILLKGRR